ncbi:hypothetical protein H0266_01650 [Halobacillus locisalis]|uniref:Uncharacterized protein n=1 Tax=Halobacillus locisalis TaxID=220753 RepID=A0A838CNT5_9BACI|nr:hypothetical protein [Halobacillus locisalis]MBA2173591.1 hypothetical protein [Halobacillus locisalis]
MVYVLITLSSVSIVLYILSFFMNNRMKELEEQLEQVSMEMMQSNYQTSQKLKVLEEELLAEDLTGEILKNQEKTTGQQPPLIENVFAMYQRGYKAHYIAKHTNLDVHDVQSLIQQWQSEGVHS